MVFDISDSATVVKVDNVMRLNARACCDSGLFWPNTIASTAQLYTIGIFLVGADSL